MLKARLEKKKDQRLQAQAQLIPEICPISFKELLLVRWLKFTFWMPWNYFYYCFWEENALEFEYKLFPMLPTQEVLKLLSLLSWDSILVACFCQPISVKRMPWILYSLHILENFFFLFFKMTLNLLKLLFWFYYLQFFLIITNLVNKHYF